ncbi:amino acid ABC transporter permease [Fluoribacter dumoffii]|uniref:Arginine transport system permease protein ArtQ n=1 Tax=Fluoribacter dumoffii TaxID=463 RepID=A0A377G9N5_9GAMM|nr:amino acid ABC transporter permease [Fluoribacter dumoffii]KTC90104.1 transporter subunit: permease component of ABC superfamily transporter [Fluoribacter dumoffii NY 23]MCW8385401.1 amino acid ABC transporter permease [Fluoribacter dumoffii]MCW8418454.1 amino acid ABC transporter permease [Fluoribacter dumoffii]MCW8453704.1 amino acid ABC transporter permease [Fluoribacter dumoffii]MCW8462225.1 amino acid ABC transporter permease [Fluoribacter dumoffii]
MEELKQNILYIGEGTLVTLILLLGGLCIGTLLGTVLALLRYQGIMKPLINSFISVMRGTPVILQLSFIYFAVPALIGMKANILMAGLLTFGLNSSAYIAEILRSGIENLPKGQFEAAKTLQIPSFYLWKDIVLPQVVKNIFPAFINEMIALLKETALIATIGGMDLMRRAQSVAAEQFTYFVPLCIAGCFYYGMVLLIELMGKKIEERGLYVSH